MSDIGDVTAVLTGLPDHELLAVVLAATTGRPQLDALRLVAAELAAGGSGHAIDAEIVSSDTDLATVLPLPSAGPAFGPVTTPLGIPRTDPSGIGGYTGGGVPTFDSVRDKVEQRFGTAQGMGELDQQTPAGRSVEEQWEAREKAARERLDRIRKSVRRNDSG